MGHLEREALRRARLTSQVVLSFRRQWLRRNKQAGLEVLQIRFGGLRERYQEVARLLQDLREGRFSSLEGLEQGRSVAPEELAKMQFGSRYGRLASPSRVA